MVISNSYFSIIINNRQSYTCLNTIYLHLTTWLDLVFNIALSQVDMRIYVRIFEV
jgi:hypothetical protein